MLNSAQNQLLILEKRGSEPCGKYESPTFKTANRRKTQKDRWLQIHLINREQNCSRRRLFTNCTLPYLTMFTILPDRGITKIAETVLVSAICGILPICSVIRLGLEPRTPTLKVLCSTSWASESPYVSASRFVSLLLTWLLLSSLGCSLKAMQSYVFVFNYANILTTFLWIFFRLLSF